MSVHHFVVLIGVSWLPRAFGVWAALSGVLQLGHAVFRWKRSGAQWRMISKWRTIGAGRSAAFQRGNGRCLLPDRRVVVVGRRIASQVYRDVMNNQRT
ncbi:hypothetical protein [Paraburkholderia monticola]|uniref:hypothetical protein n=1 Tax=Paraburkholderia monticola TaxID=1399968 RepID=UPI001F4CEC3F|nr:hypothetical protein [Paraburkholderia monticola]